jgi:ABC-2 type transport system ATP-binding protein
MEFTMLKIEGLSKSYDGKINAVDELSLCVEDGDIFGFIGHNGAGKTTTIKCITGIQDFQKGEILINGISIKEKPIDCKKIIAYIPDNPDLYEFLTGIKYLNFIGDIFDVPADIRKQRIEKYAKAFELFDDLSNPISSYSHGMKQKLAVISALIHSPKLLILDEPFVGLDPMAAHTLKEIMKEICNAGGAIFFSTHILEVAEKLCNKVAIIKDGKLVVSGDIQTVKGDSSLEDVFLELSDNG